MNKAEREAANKRIRDVDKLWHRGYERAEIAERLKITPEQVSQDLKLIKKLLEPKTIRSIEYYRNRSRKRLNQITQTAWDIVDGGNYKDGAKVSALRLVKEVEELRVKVDGVVQDKTLSVPEKKAEELQKKLLTLARQKEDEGNGHHKEEGLAEEDATTTDS